MANRKQESKMMSQLDAIQRAFDAMTNKLTSYIDRMDRVSSGMVKKVEASVKETTKDTSEAVSNMMSDMDAAAKKAQEAVKDIGAEVEKSVEKQKEAVENMGAESQKQLDDMEKRAEKTSSAINTLLGTALVSHLVSGFSDAVDTMIEVTRESKKRLSLTGKDASDYVFTLQRGFSDITRKYGGILSGEAYYKAITEVSKVYNKADYAAIGEEMALQIAAIEGMTEDVFLKSIEVWDRFGVEAARATGDVILAVSNASAKLSQVEATYITSKIGLVASAFAKNSDEYRKTLTELTKGVAAAAEVGMAPETITDMVTTLMTASHSEMDELQKQYGVAGLGVYDLQKRLLAGDASAITDIIGSMRDEIVKHRDDPAMAYEIGAMMGLAKEDITNMLRSDADLDKALAEVEKELRANFKGMDSQLEIVGESTSIMDKLSNSLMSNPLVQVISDALGALGINIKTLVMVIGSLITVMKTQFGRNLLTEIFGADSGIGKLFGLGGKEGGGILSFFKNAEGGLTKMGKAAIWITVIAAILLLLISLGKKLYNEGGEFKEMVDELKASLGQMFSALGSILGTLMSVFAKLMKPLQKVGEVLLKVIVKVLTSIIQMLTPIIEGIAMFVDWLDRLGLAAPILGFVIGALVAVKVAKAIKNLGGLTNAVKSLGGAFKALAPVLIIVAGALAGIWIFNKLKDWFDSMSPGIRILVGVLFALAGAAVVAATAVAALKAAQAGMGAPVVAAAIAVGLAAAGVAAAGIYGVISGIKESTGSYAGGIDYVPEDEHPAVLHKGEAVLTRAEANRWRASNGMFANEVNRKATVVKSDRYVVEAINNANQRTLAQLLVMAEYVQMLYEEVRSMGIEVRNNKSRIVGTW